MQDYYSPYTPNPSARDRIPTRISRGTYFLRWLLLTGGAVMAAVLIDAGSHASHGSAVPVVAGIVLLIYCVVSLFRSILIPRVRDVGLHPAWSLLILLHSIGALFVLALFFIPKDAFVRRAHVSYY